MAKPNAFHQPKRIKPAATDVSSPKPSPLLSLLILLLIGKQILFLALSLLRFPLRLALLGVSVWLGTGALLYGASYALYIANQQQRIETRAQLETTNMTWKRILISHPTSREALVGAYAHAYALGEDSQAQLYAEQLQRIDPNDERVKKLR